MGAILPANETSVGCQWNELAILLESALFVKLILQTVSSLILVSGKTRPDKKSLTLLFLCIANAVIKYKRTQHAAATKS